MKKSEKLKGKEKVQEKAASRKRTLRIVSVVAVIIIVIAGVTAYLSLYNPFVVVSARRYGERGLHGHVREQDRL